MVSRAQLLALGFTVDAIKWRVARGRLHLVTTGCLRRGSPELTRKGELMAAVLACGPGAVLSHSSAAELWRLVDEAGAFIEVSVPLPRDPRCHGLRVHRRSVLRPEDKTEEDGIPTTSPVATIIDIAAGLKPRALEAAINEGDKRNLFTPASLRMQLESIPPRQGVAPLRKLLDRHTFLLTDSDLERRFVPIVRRSGLPDPLTREWVNGFRVDFYWPDLRLVVETDGLRYHRTPAQQARDRLRDQAHTAAGLTTLRFTHGQIRYETDHVEATLAATARRLATRSL